MVDDPAQLVAVTKRVMDAYTFAGYLFTALDISNTVKESLPAVRHREVSPVVRDLFEKNALGDDYTRTMIDVMAEGTTPAQAYLYHLKTDDPKHYDDRRRQQTAIPPVSIAIEDDLVIDIALEEIEVTVGKDGRGRLARQFLENAGLKTDEIHLERIGLGPSFVLMKPEPQAQPAAILSYAHPSLLHLPKRFMDAFDPAQPVTARSVRGTVEVTGSLRP
jgi:hypothetical protein